MSDELTDEDPFAEGGESEEKNQITEGMVRKATFLIHKLAERKGQDFKEIQKKCKKLFGYVNLAKVTMEEGHKIIDKLIELTGGEEEVLNHIHKDEQEVLKGSQLPTKADDGSRKREQPIKQDESEKIEELEAELGKLAEMLQICVGFSRYIVNEEIGKDNITEGTQAMLIKSFAATLYIDASKRGLGR
jgi:hypothetical protein